MTVHFCSRSLKGQDMRNPLAKFAPQPYGASGPLGYGKWDVPYFSMEGKHGILKKADYERPKRQQPQQQQQQQVKKQQKREEPESEGEEGEEVIYVQKPKSKPKAKPKAKKRKIIYVDDDGNEIDGNEENEDEEEEPTVVKKQKGTGKPPKQAGQDESKTAYDKFSKNSKTVFKLKENAESEALFNSESDLCNHSNSLGSKLCDNTQLTLFRLNAKDWASLQWVCDLICNDRVTRTPIMSKYIQAIKKIRSPESSTDERQEALVEGGQTLAKTLGDTMRTIYIDPQEDA